jgi:hypothetical protein
MIARPDNMNDDTPLWHDREGWQATTAFLGRVFGSCRNEVAAVVEHARELRKLMAAASSFIQDTTAAVCPSCPRVCCINRHGYYDRNDLVYIYALGLEPPAYQEGRSDKDPCQFLSGDGCSLDRGVRPFRCNWYFCTRLTRHMEEGPARPYRQFLNRFQAVVEARRLMLEEFSHTVNLIALFPAECCSMKVTNDETS